MSTPTNDGGPAFPNKDELGTMIPGMSLRDYFAAKALQGIISTFSDPHARLAAEAEGQKPRHLAIMAYELADAMLAARNQTTK